MKIVFLGTPAPAVPFLETLQTSTHDVVRVVTRPDRPAGRSGRLQPPPVKRCADDLGLEVVQPRSVRRGEFAADLAALGVDVLVVVAYGRILPGQVLESARFGAVNVHFSLLPRFRGAAPVQWTLARGEMSTGVTTMQLDEGMDTGDILLQRELTIEPREHAPALQARLVDSGVGLLLDTLEALGRESIRPVPQDPERATYAPMLSREDGEPSPELFANDLEGRIRGFDPWPGVWFSRRGTRIRFLDAWCVPGRTLDAPAGRVVALEDDRLLVACGGGSCLAVERLQPEGRRGLTARDAVNGRQLIPGDRLERVTR